MISLPNNKRAYSVNPSAMPSRLMSDDEDENGVPPIRGRHKRESLNPAMAAGMIDQLRTLFKAMATHGDKEDAEKAQSQQRAHSIASVSNLKDLVSLGEDIEDDAHYLEASESAEGPPSHRVFACLNYRVLAIFLVLLFQ